jgi:hypothetical protein
MPSLPLSEPILPHKLPLNQIKENRKKQSIKNTSGQKEKTT